MNFNFFQMPFLARMGGVGAVVIMLGACSTAGSILDGDRIDYKSAARGNSLEVPPDLTQLAADPRYAAANDPKITASAFQANQTLTTQNSDTNTATNQIGDVRVERSGDQRWLVVDRPADKLWEPVREFWQENGFLLAVDQPNVGIMETDWAENRAKLPQDIIRKTLGKVLDTLYSTGELDKFRTRLERTGDGTTEIFISHRGMVEVYTSKQEDNTVWQPRPSDHELEAEFLRRLMVKLGVPQERSEAMAASGISVQIAAKNIQVDGAPALELQDGFDRAWRRVGLALDRTGFTVEDRDRSKGIYFVRYVPPNANKKKAGFFGKLFGKSNDADKTVRYRIAVRPDVSDENRQTAQVLVLSATEDTPDKSENASNILKVLLDELK